MYVCMCIYIYIYIYINFLISCSAPPQGSAEVGREQGSRTNQPNPHQCFFKPSLCI